MGDGGGPDQYMTYLKETLSKQYNEIAVDHMINPRNCEELTEFSGFGMADYGVDHSVMIWLKTEGENVIETSFSSDPCYFCTAAGSAVSEIARNKTISDLKAIDREQVLQFLHGLPEDSYKCIDLAVDAIHAAADDAEHFVPLA